MPMLENSPEQIRQIIDECESGRPLSEAERGLLTYLVDHICALAGANEVNLPIIERAKTCLKKPETRERSGVERSEVHSDANFRTLS